MESIGGHFDISHGGKPCQSGADEGKKSQCQHQDIAEDCFSERVFHSECEGGWLPLSGPIVLRPGISTGLPFFLRAILSKTEAIFR